MEGFTGGCGCDEADSTCFVVAPSFRVRRSGFRVGPGRHGPDHATLTWRPRLDTSRLSPVSGAEDDFGQDVAGAVARAAQAVPNGGSQSSLVEDGQTADETTVEVVRDDWNLAYEVTDGARWVVRIPGLPGIGFSLALFTDTPPALSRTCRATLTSC